MAWIGIECNATTGRVIQLLVIQGIGTPQVLDLSVDGILGCVENEGHAYGGTFPKFLHHHALRYVDFSHAKIKGEFPLWLLQNNTQLQNYPTINYKIECPNLYHRKVFYNYFGLITLDLSHNNFLGDIPEWIGLLSHISFLVNQEAWYDLEEVPAPVVAPVPAPVVESHEEVSHVASTPKSQKQQILEATIDDDEAPHDYSNSILELRTKNASYYYSSSILKYMPDIDLSCNNLAGEVPPELGNLNNIKLLNLSHNSLSGEIPPTFSKLREIETLDLSFNLIGTIPPQFIGLSIVGNRCSALHKPKLATGSYRITNWYYFVVDNVLMFSKLRRS
ncbi:hypothetical protein Tsubulata_014093 [Turnera subulata]|uniref:Leucine-rich repeat-containing N-terminal plant-type domain-containing protein n=1 Tax=Turnera subulata TaxID=218843 RepID=A0A9Q0JN72_9ROSI|nr:hypothetical protein Tsubulata_014093 [Turnera subulata]